MAYFAILTLAMLIPSSVEPSDAVLAAQQDRVALIESFSPSVVCIFGRDAGGGGTGVLISPDGYALTNFHVVAGAGDFMRCGLSDGKLYDAIVVGIDPTGDVALIKLLGREDFPFAPLGDSDQVRVGDWVCVVGNPFLLATDFQPTVTYGIVSGTHRYQYPAGTFLEYTDCIQFDTSLNPGNSGGPLFNSQGEVVGINGRGSFEKRGRVNVGAGYAISINQIKHFLDHLRSGRVVDHGTIEATVATRDDGTVRIASILEDSDAYRLGLRSGDEIVRFAGRPIRSANQFQNVLGIYPRGWTLPLTYRRGTETHQILIPLRGAHRASELLKFSQSRPDQQNPQPGKTPPAPEGEKTPPEHPELPGFLQPPDEPEIPAELRKLVVERVGYTNYRFNEIEQQRVLKALAKDVHLEIPKAAVVLAGMTSDDKSARFTIAEQVVGATLGGREYLQQLGGAGELLDEPPGSGGLLGALHILEQILGDRTERLADFYYHGSEPLDGSGPLVDVLIGENRGGRMRVLVDRESGMLTGIDFRRADRAARMRIRFEASRVESEIGTLPKVWAITVAGEEWLTFNLEQITRLAEEEQRND